MVTGLTKELAVQYHPNSANILFQTAPSAVEPGRKPVLDPSAQEPAQPFRGSAFPASSRLQPVNRS